VSRFITSVMTNIPGPWRLCADQHRVVQIRVAGFLAENRRMLGLYPSVAQLSGENRLWRSVCCYRARREQSGQNLRIVKAAAGR
jgi:hypothetical protein